MTIESTLLQDAIKPALCALPASMDTPAARVMILAIFGQEADFKHRWQVVNKPGVKGPARGLPQMEKSGGGITGIFDAKRFPTLSATARAFSLLRGVGPTADDRYAAVEVDDVYAAGLARLLLWSDPKPIPAVGQEQAAFELYQRTWRPGAWDRGTPEQRAELRRKWAGYYKRAVDAVTADAS